MSHVLHNQPDCIVINQSTRRKCKECIPSESVSLSGEGSDDGPWLYVVFVSVIFQVQVHFTATSLLDQLTRNLAITTVHISK